MPHTRVAFEWLERRHQDFTKTAETDFESLLYVGWRRDSRNWWYDFLCKRAWNISKVALLEIFPKNLQDFEHEVQKGRFGARSILGDVREIEKHVGKHEYDVIFWDHGPEHVSLEDFNITTRKLIDHSKHLLLYCCPWGEWTQGAEDGNEHETHLTSVEPEMFTPFDMAVQKFGESGQFSAGELIAYFLKK